MDGPIVSVLAFCMAAWFLRQWLTDRKDAAAGNPHPKALPGATFCSIQAVILGAIGGIGIAGAVTVAEIAAGVSADQSDIAVSFLLAMLGAAVIEEMIFRGWLVIADKGRAALIGSCIAVSLVFTLCHPFLWDWQAPLIWDWKTPFVWEWVGGGLRFSADLQAILSAVGIFSLSLWLYAVRFLPINPTHSLLPCFLGHAAHNLVVFIVKLAMGHVLLG